MSRINRITFEAVTITAVQDLLGIRPAAGKMIRILHRWIGATDTTLVAAQSIALRERFLPATVTPGTGGTTPSIVALDPGDSVSNATVWVNATAKATTSGTANLLWENGCHIWTGYDDDLDAPYVIGPLEAYVFELLSTVSGVVHLSGGLTFEEIGG
jgi:hypothetical protein